MVMSDLTAPTAKCATMLMANAATTAGTPLMKKKGMIGMKAPTAVEAFGPKPHAEIAPASMQAVYEFPAREKMPAVKMTWHQGTFKPPQWTEKKIPQSFGSGVLFVGDKGMLLSDYFKHVLLPEKQFADFKRPEPFIEKSRGHYA